MSPETVRLLFVSGLSILLGGFIGAYATKSIYDTPQSAHNPNSHERLSCPPCADCPQCPPPPDCGDHGVVPSSTTATRPILVPDSEETERDKKAGLPASAIKLASEKVRASIEPCLQDAMKAGAHGSLLLELTVTATGSEGFISDVAMGKRSGGTITSEEIDRCLIESARRARFEWDEEDGEARFRLPIRLGR